MELCNVCYKNINKNHRALKCKTCDHKVHIHCNKISPQTYQRLKEKENSEIWMCISCHNDVFPFRTLDSDSDESETNIQDLDVRLNQKDKKTLELISSLILENSDPDNENASFCKYYKRKTFRKSKFDNKSSLSIFHLNIASLQYHFDDILILLDSLDFTFDILTFSETKLKVYDKPRQIKNDFYDIIHTPTEAEKGGTIIYAAKNLYAKPRDDLNIYEPKMLESTFIEIQVEKSKTHIIGCVYKHHNIGIREFSENLKNTMKKINIENKPAYITGDFNVNLLQIELNNEIDHYYEQVTDSNFLPLITLPTRITSRSKTLIDNILTNNFNSDIISGNLTVNISDHMPQFVIIPLPKKKTFPKKHNIFIRETKKMNINELRNEIQAINFEYTNSGDCLNTDTKRFITETNKIIDKHAPLRKITNKEIKERMKPWITKGIRRSIKQRNRLFSKLKNEQQPNIKEKLKTKIKCYKNKINTPLEGLKIVVL